MSVLLFPMLCSVHGLRAYNGAEPQLIQLDMECCMANDCGMYVLARKDIQHFSELASFVKAHTPLVENTARAWVATEQRQSA